MITPISYNNVPLNDGFFSSDLQGAFDADKTLLLNDILSDGQVYGRSKTTERKLLLQIVAGGYNLARLTTLNKMFSGNTVKPLVIDTDIGRLIGYAEITRYAWNDDTPLLSSCQLTMPDPHWYTLQPNTLSLEPSITTGVVFSMEQIVLLHAGSSAAANRLALDAGNSGCAERTLLRGPQSDV